MAKSALLDVLEQTIGKYVKNLDAESLNVAVWSGKIELHSLQLDVDAVNAELDRQAAEAPNLALPLKVLSGSFHSFQVDVPWAQLTSRPVVLRAKGLKVEVEQFDRLAQVDHLQADVASEAKRIEKIKLAREKAIEESNKYRLQAYAMRKLALDESSSESQSSFGTRLVRRIIENIQIEISDVHVSLTDVDGSFGVVLDSLTLETTDKEGNRVFIDRTTGGGGLDNSFLYKALQIDGFGIYVDHEESYLNPRKLRPISEGSDQQRAPELLHSYVLAPLSFQAKLRQADGTVCVDYAKYQLQSELSSLSILLSRNQLDLTRKISRQVSSSETAACPLFPEYRPVTRVTKDTAKDWWKYAVRCIGRLNGRRSWVEFFIAFQKRKRYIPLYKRHAHHSTCTWIKELTSAESDELTAIEEDRSLSVEGIMQWRTVADSQADREREKRESQTTKESKSMFSSIFGSSTSKKTAVDEPPVTLTTSELKELESMAREEFAEPELSKDSRLCDLSFVLNAFKINLTSYDQRHVAALDMGAVMMDFKAAADGAFSFAFDLADIEILDRATPNTLFPSTLISTNKRMTGDAKELKAMSLHLSKTKSGDQELRLKLATFEMVASQILFREMHRFISDAPFKQSTKTKQNPMLAQSISGSVDLFYDADDGDNWTASAPTSIVEKKAPPNSTTVSDLSNALVEAWKEKAETKASWMIDVDIKAPVIILPEQCNNTRANVLVLDLGHFRLKYGKMEPSEKVRDWFKENPKICAADEILDSGSLTMEDLTFKVGKAGHIHESLTKVGNTNITSGDIVSIIEPISVLLDVGVESYASDDPSRVCCIGVVPAIGLRFSTRQASQIFPVISSWTCVLEDITEPAEETEVPMVDPTVGEALDETTAKSLSTEIVPSTSDVSDSSKKPKIDPYPIFYAMVGLQRLSVTLESNENDVLEAHLVSVYASVSKMSDASTLASLRMGWFWILDGIQCDFPRQQRLVAHSNLPRPAESFAADGKYDVLGELTKQGVFEREYAGSTELADISYRQGMNSALVKKKEDTSQNDDDGLISVLDANFSSLFIHWNPHAVKGITSVIESFSVLADEHSSIISEHNSVIMSPGKPKSGNGNTPRAGNVGGQTDQELKGGSARMLIKARMDSFDVSLNSAKDDLPLFILTVSCAEIEMTSQESQMDVSLSLGDLRVRSVEELGSTLSSYRTLIGLAPGRNESLLTARYLQGKCASEMVDAATYGNNVEAFAEVELSPMRMLYIQSQVMALVEYITEGILGVVTAQAASSAAGAALEMANTVGGVKVFLVKATSFDLILPQAAYSTNCLSVNAGSLDVAYIMYAVPGGSKASVSLTDVTLLGPKGNQMQEKPISMSVNVRLPSDQVGDFDEQAMRVDIGISDASFILAKNQYITILRMLDDNIGDLDLHLRDESVPASGEDLVRTEKNTDLTHAGVQFVQRVRRMYLGVKIEVLSLQLRSGDPDEAVVRLTAVSTDVKLNQYPDKENMTCAVSLRNLLCEDCRPKAANRQYRFLVDQTSTAASSASVPEEDLFCVGYSSGKNESTIDLNVGSPQIVLIPDAISAALEFFQTEESSMGIEQGDKAADTEADDIETREVVQIGSDMSGENIETNLVTMTDNPGDLSAMLSMMKITLKTKTCRIVLVDLGSQLSGDLVRGQDQQQQQQQQQSVQLTETLVLQGSFNSSLSLASDISTRKTVSADFQGQGDAMEIFSAFGRELKSPLQVLEPSEGSVHGSMKSSNDGNSEIEVRAATLTPFDFTFSMHTAALLNAILNSLGESFAKTEADESKISPESLTKQETERIEHLATALESTSTTSSVSNRDSLSVGEASSTLATAPVGSSGAISKVQVKITMPEMSATVVNDLQGLDEALFRVSVKNFVAGGDVTYGVDSPSSKDMTFDFHLNTSILADYFDASLNLWSTLLTKPWEATLKGMRSPSRRFKSDRFSTTIDLESFPCCIAFSEQFLVSLASASRMWSIYSVATTVEAEDDAVVGSDARRNESIKNSMAASAARNLITSLPYAVENHCGVDSNFSIAGGSITNRPCPDGFTQYFRFEPPRGRGYGGRRAYGQDVEYEKTVTIFLGGSEVVIGHMDAELGLPRRSHALLDGGVLITQVLKEGKTTVLHLTSHVDVVNRTSLPFNVSVIENEKRTVIGVCGSNNQGKGNTPISTTNGISNKSSRNFSIPIQALQRFVQSWSAWGEAQLNLEISPCISQHASTAKYPDLYGMINVAPSLQKIRNWSDGELTVKSDVTCRPGKEAGRAFYPLVVQVLLTFSIVGETHVHVNVCLEPRAVIENKIPVAIKIRTPMPHTFCTSSQESAVGKDVAYHLAQGDRVEVFTPGPSIAVNIKTSDNPVAGSALDWLEGGWIDLPLVSEFRLVEPIRCLFPFSKESIGNSLTSGVSGSEFFILEGYDSLADLGVSDEEISTGEAAASPPAETSLLTNEPQRSFFITVCYYGVDHSGDILFEQVSTSSGGSRGRNSLTHVGQIPRRRSSQLVSSPPFSAFASERHRRRVSLLPDGKTPIRILQMTMDQEAGLKKSLPFIAEELVIGEGGVDTTPIYWENRKPSGYYAYRTIVNEHQSEVHVVPEFLVFNGSNDVLLVREKGKPEIIVESKNVAQLRVDSREQGLHLALIFIELGCYTQYIRVDKLGLKVAILNAKDGYPVGSVCVQTVIDTHGDARLVVKVGEIKTGALMSNSTTGSESMFKDDFLRFRVRWTELQLILNETKEIKNQSRWTGAISRVRSTFSPKAKSSPSSQVGFSPSRNRDGAVDIVDVHQQPLATVIFSRFTFDFQRVFKDPATQSARDMIHSPERSQLSIIVHNVQIKDLTPDTKFPIVFDSTSNTSVVDLCVRTKGPWNADLVQVDLFDLNLAHNNGRSELMALTTSEDYVWRILDMVNRILAASGDFAGVALTLVEDKEHGGFIVKIEDSRSSLKEDQKAYTPPKSDTLYDIKLARVSPFKLMVSFKRNPQATRYQKVSKVQGAALMNYFVRKLKFTIDRAELSFARYENRTLKGPSDRLVEALVAVYLSRLKFKVVTLLSAVSLQDWRFLAARDDGEEGFEDGDILRATGNLAGKSANLVLKRVGQGLGNGVSDLSRAVGNTIETSTEFIGAGRVGAGVNSVVSGVGEGVGDTLTGVGTGAGKMLKGVGQGVGHVFGGVAGGALQVGKGIGKGIKTGDGKAVVKGFAKGATSMGSGIAQGAESAVIGAADGFFSAGKGLVTGVKSVGKGFGGAFKGKKRSSRDERN